jgi:DMSO/TMAO reductase YedYZ molybdopterin-dependent catalytic subunit
MSRHPMILTAVLVGLPLLVGTAACTDISGTAQTTALSAPVATSTATSVASPSTTIVAPEDLEPVVQPTLPADVPGYLDVDPATGLHMTGTPTVVEIASYRLKVTGDVANELSLTYDELRLLPKVTATPELICPGFFVDTATWSGVPLNTILQMAEVQPEATQIRMKAADGYLSIIDLETALDPESFLAYELMGQTLPVLQGFPLRAVFPGRDGNRWVKWLLEIEVE